MSGTTISKDTVEMLMASVEAVKLSALQDLGLTLATLDAGSDHEENVPVLVADPRDGRGVIPLFIQVTPDIFRRLTPLDGDDVSLEGQQEDLEAFLGEVFGDEGDAA